MNMQSFTEWTSWSTPFVDVNREASEQAVRECISFCSDNTATAVKYMQTMPRITSWEDWVNMQTKLLMQQGEKTLEFSQNLFQIYQEAFKKHMQTTQQKVNTAVKSTSKSKED
jgi:hypothetical protein